MLNARTAATGYGKIWRFDKGCFEYYDSLDFCNTIGNMYESPVDITPPWGTVGSNDQLFQSYTRNKDHIWYVSWDLDGAGAPAGRSVDGGLTWTRLADVPFRPACASGFPYNNQWMAVGRIQYGGATAADKVMIVGSNDAGQTWVDKTGDLWDNVDAVLGHPSSPGLTTSLVTIAPEW